MFRLVPVLFLLLLVSGALSQELPDKIRGYKVHREKISVNANSSSADASVKVGDPEVVDLS